MPARVTAGQVKEIIETELTEEVIESNMIETANAILDDAGLGAKLSQRLLAQVELYLAAHFVALTEERGGLVKSNYGSSEEWLSDSYGQGFNMTRYGQQAIALDTSGTLAKIGGTTKLKAEFRVV